MFIDFISHKYNYKLINQSLIPAYRMYMAVSIKNGYLVNGEQDKKIVGTDMIKFKEFKVLRENIANKFYYYTNGLGEKVFQLFDKNELQNKLINKIINIDEIFDFMDYYYGNLKCGQFKLIGTLSLSNLPIKLSFQIFDKVDESMKKDLYDKLNKIEKKDNSYENNLFNTIKSYFYDSSKQSGFLNILTIGFCDNINNKSDNAIKINSKILYRIFIDSSTSSSSELLVDEKIIIVILLNFLNFVLEKLDILRKGVKEIETMIQNLTNIKLIFENLKISTDDEGLAIEFKSFKHLIFNIAQFWNNPMFKDFFFDKNYFKFQKKLSCTLIFQNDNSDADYFTWYTLNNISLFQYFNVDTSIQMMRYIFNNDKINVTIIIVDNQQNFYLSKYDTKKLWSDIEYCIGEYCKKIIILYYNYKLSVNLTKFKNLSIKDKIKKEKNILSKNDIDILIKELNAIKIEKENEEKQSNNNVK